MKKIVLAILIILFLCPFSYAYYLHEKSFYSDDKLNGVCWRKLNEEQKITLLFGFKDGIKACIQTKLIYGPAGLSDESILAIPKDIYYFVTPKGIVINIMKYLNKFYSDEANLYTPIIEVFCLMIDEWNGKITSDEQRNAKIEELRAKYKKSP